ncbi:MAG: PEP-CTERM sorting domain-containing protein [Phycisphaerae bacterium]
MSGATLFATFFRVNASTNDWIDVDNDGFKGYQSHHPYVQNLATPWSDISDYSSPYDSTHWIVQYRGVGSGNGLKELVDYNETHSTANGTPSGAGRINGEAYYDDDLVDPTNATWYTPANDSPSSNYGGTPVIPDSIDVAVMDVPTTWFVQNTNDAGAWNKAPGQPGYGTNPNDSVTGQSNKVKSLGTLDPAKMHDTQLAWVPIAYIANSGTALENVKKSELQHLFTTGRMPNGENLNAATRDSGSGTRNGGMNSLGIDPSWGVGDNLGDKTKIKPQMGLGYTYVDGEGWVEHQYNNLGSSSIMEGAAQNNMLAVGYTGLLGGSKAREESNDGKYEVLNLMNDIDGGTVYVRPSIDSILDTLDVDTGYQAGGPETMATYGDPDLPGSDPMGMANAAAAAYVKNIEESIKAFEEFTGSSPDPETDFSPGQYLADTFVLMSAIDGIPGGASPAQFVENLDLNTTLQDYTRSNNEMADSALTLKSYGHWEAGAGRVPLRGDLTVAAGAPIDKYSDGSSNGNYKYYDKNGNEYEAVVTEALNARNRVAGDFNGDGDRDITDIDQMMVAVMDQKQFMVDQGFEADDADSGDLEFDVAIPSIIGDYNGDGNFDKHDVRFFCDGLAIKDGKLDRFEGFKAADEKYMDMNGEYFFHSTDANAVMTTIANPGVSYQAGFAAADVAGMDTTPGAAPVGADGSIDANDIDYMLRCKKGDFTIIDEAIGMDLSCDMNGDLIVDDADVDFVLKTVLDSHYGDSNLDGQVSLADLSALAGNWNSTDAGWAMGDFNGDDMVSLADLSALAGNWNAGTVGVGNTTIPEPATMTLLGLLGLAGVIRRRK